MLQLQEECKAFYLHLALTRWYNDNPQDRDIPFIGLSESAQQQVRDRAKLFEVQDEPHRLRRLMNYRPVGANA
jgi:hypothetical protein